MVINDLSALELIFNCGYSRAGVVAQLVEQLLPIPELRSSNPDISKILTTNSTIEKKKIKKIKKKRPGIAHNKKTLLLLKSIQTF